MINKLIKLSNYLDSNGYRRESNYVDNMIKKLSSDPKERMIGLMMKQLDYDNSGALEERELADLVDELARYISLKEKMPHEDAFRMVIEMAGLGELSREEVEMPVDSEEEEHDDEPEEEDWEFGWSPDPAGGDTDYEDPWE